MLTYPLAERGDLSLYEFLYRCLRTDILNGRFKPGEKLPSKRQLAENLSVSVITVQQAYELLQSEGYIYSIEKKGFFIQQPAQKIPTIRKLPAKAPAPRTKAKKWLADFTGNEVPGEHFPLDGWGRSVRKALRRPPEDLLTPTDTAGLYELRSAIAAHLIEYRGIRTDPESIVIGSGAENLYDRLVQLLGRELHYATEFPGHRKFNDILKASQIRCTDIPIDREGLSITALRTEQASVVHLSPSHQFPTGIVMPAGRRHEILEWAAASPERRIIEDDYDCELRLQGRPVRTMFSMDHRNRVIYMNTFSRTLAPSFRIAYMVLPPDLTEQWQQKLSFYRCPVPNLDQWALADFIRNGSFGRHINRMRTIYRNRRLQILSNIRQAPMAEHVEIIERDAGTHFMLALPVEQPPRRQPFRP